MSKKQTVVVDASLEDIMPRFLEIRAQELVLMREALASGDGQQLSFYGHRLKGSGGGYGLDRLTELGATIEVAGQEVDLDRARRAVDSVADYMNNLEIIYEEME